MITNFHAQILYIFHSFLLSCSRIILFFAVIVVSNWCHDLFFLEMERNNMHFVVV